MQEGKLSNRVGSAVSLELEQLYDLRALGEAEGAEGMATSFVGRWAASGQRVSVKVAAQPFDQQLEQAFELLKNAASPALPDPVALLRDGKGRTCLVSAWVQGQSLVESMPKDPAQLLSGWIDLARGLEQLHRRGLWHGDPSLANVVLRPDASMSWIDFGLLGHHGGGTPGFFAPETLQGQGGPAADLFGLACLMGRMWTGALPFADLQALAQWQGGTELPMPWAQCSRPLPEALARLLLVMLDPDPQLRPSAQDVVVELELVRTTLFDELESGVSWQDPGRLPYLGDELDRLCTQWSSMGPKAGLLALCGEPGSGRGRMLEELAMRLEAKGHPVERIEVPCVELAPSLLSARWLDCQDKTRTLIVTGLDASAWIESLGGLDALLELRTLAAGRLVMPDLQPASDGRTHRRDFILGRWSKATVAKAVGLFWSDHEQASAQAQRRRVAWGDWLFEEFQGRAGTTVQELRRIAAHQARDPGAWRLARATPDAQVSSWNVARLCQANSAAAIDENLSLWQGWPVADQLTLALAWSKAGWEIKPQAARVLGSALLAQGLHKEVLRALPGQDAGACFVRARTLQASAQTQASAQMVQSMIADPDPSAKVAGLALQLRAKIDAGTIDHQSLVEPKALQAADLWARAWWVLWSAYAKLSRDEAAGLQALRELPLQTAGLNVVERAPVLARAAQLLGNHAWARGQRAKAYTHYQDCTRWFCAGGESVGEAMAAGNVAALAFAGGELSLALKQGERAIGALMALNAWQPLAVLVTNHIRLLGLLKRTRRAQDLYDRVRLGVESGSIDAARLDLAIADVQNRPLSPACLEALSSLEGKVPARELADTQLQLARRAWLQGQREQGQAFVEALDAISLEDHPQLGLWAQISIRDISGRPLSFRFWDLAQVQWQALEQSSSPMVSLAWSHRLLQLQAQDPQGLGAPAWIQEKQGFQSLFDKVLTATPYSDKSAVQKRFSLAPPSAPARQVSARALPSAPKSAPAFGGWGPLLGNLERWVQCRDLQELQEALLLAALDWANAERGMLVIRDSQGQRVVAREFGSRVDSLVTSRTIVEGVFEKGEGVVTVDARSDQRFEHAPSVTHLNLRSVLASPLRGVEGIFGVIYLDARMRRGAFVEEHLVALEHFARIASLLWQQTKHRLALQAQLVAVQGEHGAMRQRLEQRELEDLRNRESQRNHPAGPGFDYFGLLGRSEKMAQVTQLIDRYAGSTAPVVVVGEAGTGKKTAVRALHAAGYGQQAPLVMQGLAQVPDSLARELLFGASQDSSRPSLFEVAATGILYLEGVQTLEPALQKELLLYLEKDKQSPVARLVVGSTVPLEALVERGELRQDLSYRLNVLRLELPALRQRLDDLPEFVHHWIREKGRSDLSISAAAMRALSRYAWPGNLRELEQEVARLCVICEQRIEKEDLSAWVLSAHREGGKDPDDLRLRPRVEALEREIVARALERSQGNQSHAATLLGLSRFGLQKKLRRWEQEEKESGT